MPDQINILLGCELYELDSDLRAFRRRYSYRVIAQLDKKTDFKLFCNVNDITKLRILRIFFGSSLLMYLDPSDPDPTISFYKKLSLEAGLRIRIRISNILKPEFGSELFLIGSASLLSLQAYPSLQVQSISSNSPFTISCPVMSRVTGAAHL